MPLQATSGAASYDGYGGGVPFEPIYIEQIFATHLYTGNGSTQTITNGIDLSGKGGLVWTKCRGATARSHILIDTVRGASSYLSSNLTDAAATTSVYITGFNANGYGIDYGNAVNASPNTFASWTFRKQPKFFDVVTYTGNGTTQAISHNLGSVPGFIIIKKTNSAEDWWCFHRYDFTYRTKLNATNAAVNTTSAKYLGNNVTDVAPTSTTFTVGDTGGLNGSGDTFVAYLFAHDAGGFGLTGTDNVISCGSWTGNGAEFGSLVNLGYEPQWILLKNASSGTENWIVIDNMRGMAVELGTEDSGDLLLFPNLSNAEINRGRIRPEATGFTPRNFLNVSSNTYIYIAIRRGPMKTPTSGTSVFTPTTYTGNGTSQTESAGFPTDMAIITNRGSGGGYERNVGDRLRGGNRTLFTTLTVAESTATNRITAFDNMVGVSVGSDGDVNQSSGSQIAWNFRRAPGFFDVVCYTGNGVSGRVLNHNLGVAPEMMIVKKRSAATQSDWVTQTAANNFAAAGYLNSADGFLYSASLYSPTATTFTASGDGRDNASGATYVAYLFATVAGVSKVGSYTGTGTTKQIDCGFTGGARWVMIKRTDSTGDWYVWDSARGIVAGNDPYLLLNSTAAEVTNTDYIDTYSAGFEISSTAPAAINANGGTFIFLAIA